MPNAAAVQVIDEEVPRGPLRKWLTLDEAAIRLRFPSKRALLYYLRRNPAPVFKRNGSRRYFMRDEDIDKIMIRVARVDSDTTDARDEEFTPVPNGKLRPEVRREVRRPRGAKR